MFHRIAVWRVFVTLDFSTFSTKSRLFGPCRVSRHGLPHLAEVRPGEELGTKMLGFIRAEVSDPNEGKHLRDAA